MNTNNTYKKNVSRRKNLVRRITVTGILAGIATVLMFWSFPVPFMPFFIKLDISELPALIASFAFGPIEGIAVCFIKNLINAFFSKTGLIGELSNFLLGCAFVFPAGLLYKIGKNKKSAVVGSIIGASAMALISLPVNYFITYPAYIGIMGFKLDDIIAAYRAIFSGVGDLFSCLVIFNVPFTLLKAGISVIITLLIYKRISPLLHGVTK